MKFIDYCSGAGGASQGIVKVGGEAVAAVESNLTAMASYGLNHRTAALCPLDVALMDPRDMPDHDVAVWCPPCQEFSWASGKSAFGAEGRVMKEMLRYMRVNRPRYFMFENVPAVRRWAGFVHWQAELRRIGYWLADEVIQAARWLPQERERYVCVGRLGTSPPQLPEGKKRLRTARDVIDLAAGEWSPVSERVPRVRREIIAAREKYGRLFLLSANTAQRPEWAGRSIDRPIGAVTTIPHWLVVRGEEVRYITPEESARFQGFPRRYRFHGGQTEVYRQIGNAMPGAMAGAIFEALVS